MTICTFFITNPWFNACFKFFMCMTYFLSCQLAISFFTVSILILSGKKGKSFWRLRTFSGRWTTGCCSRKFITIFIAAFYQTYIKMSCIFNKLKTSNRQILWHYPSIQIIYIRILKIWKFFILYIFMYLLLTFAY